DQRRRIAWTYTHRSGHPAPASRNEDPAPIMERSKAPGCIVNPGPAPRLNPGPVAVAIRRPAHVDPCWKPHAAVGADFSPATVIVEIFISDYVRRNVPSRHVAPFPIGADAAPLVESIQARSVEALVRERHSAEETNLAVRIDAHSVAVTGRDSLSFPDCHQRHVAIGIN